MSRPTQAFSDKSLQTSKDDRGQISKAVLRAISVIDEDRVDTDEHFTITSTPSTLPAGAQSTPQSIAETVKADLATMKTELERMRLSTIGTSHSTDFVPSSNPPTLADKVILSLQKPAVCRPIRSQLENTPLPANWRLALEARDDNRAALEEFGQRISAIEVKLESDQTPNAKQLLLNGVASVYDVSSLAENALDDVYYVYARLANVRMCAPGDRWAACIHDIVQPSFAKRSLLVHLYLEGGCLSLSDVADIAVRLEPSDTFSVSFLVAFLYKRVSSAEHFSASATLVLVRAFEILVYCNISNDMLEDLWRKLMSCIGDDARKSVVTDAFITYVACLLENSSADFAALLETTASSKEALFTCGPYKAAPFFPVLVIKSESDQWSCVPFDRLALEARDGVGFIVKDYPSQGHSATLLWDDKPGEQALKGLIGSKNLKNIKNFGKMVDTRQTYIDQS